jgi:VWFA-related protein
VLLASPLFVFWRSVSPRFVSSLLPEPAFAASPQISVQVSVVSVPVTVTDSRGDFVSGLTRENFRLVVDGAPEPVEYFAAEQEPAQVLILIETGPAVYLLRHEHISASVALLEGLGTGDRVAIASYSDAARLVLDFTTEKQRAAAAIGSLDYVVGMADLNFYDSLRVATDWAGAHGGKSAIVALTTGLDGSGAGHWAELAAKLQKSNVMILPVALGGELRDSGVRVNKKRGSQDTGASSVAASGEEMSFAESNRALESIAAETGGHAFFPRSARDFDEAYRRIDLLLRHAYNLGFAARTPDARYHTIQVQVVDASGREFNGKEHRPAYRWSSRRGFLAPPPQ